MASLPTLSDGIALTHFIVAEDVERAAHFYGDVLGGEIVLAGEPTPEQAGRILTRPSTLLRASVTLYPSFSSDLVLR
jgi:hypothetical protein